MGRIARVVLPGYAHHVMQRGVRGTDLFASEADQREYLRLMAEQAKRFGLRFLAWCLMTNHVHLIAVPDEPEGLAHGIGEAHRLFTRMVNFRTGLRGYLFQGRFYSCPLDEPHTTAAARYVERNPVRAGLAGQAWDYPWSSAAFNVGATIEDPLVQKSPWNASGEDWRALLIHDPAEMPFLRKRTRSGRPCGNKCFIAEAERTTGRNLERHRPGRPDKQIDESRTHGEESR